MAENVGFTAFIVARSQIVASHLPDFSSHVRADALELAEACVKTCGAHSAIFRIINAVPVALSVWLLDRIVVTGFVRHVVARKQRIRAAAQEAISGGAKQLVVVGAGYDALALSIAREHPDVICVEVDLPGVQTLKRAALEQLGPLPANLHLNPCDFSQSTLVKALAGHAAFRANTPTVFVAEALSMYLTERENRTLLTQARDIGGNSTVFLFTVLESLHMGVEKAGAGVRKAVLGARKESFRWSMAERAMPAFAGECGYDVRQALNYAEIQRPYVPPERFEQLKKYRSENFYVLGAKKDLI